jgi:hypothetical protein
MTYERASRRAAQGARWLGAATAVGLALLACSGDDHPAPAGSSGSTGTLPDGGPGDGGPGGPGDGASADGRIVTDDGGEGDGAPDAALCMPLAFVGPYVDEQGIAAPAPAPAGGSITLGTYDIEALSEYDVAADGPTGRIAQSTLVITVNQLRISDNLATGAGGVPSSAPVQTTRALSYMAKNTKLATAQYCPPPSEEKTVDYTATPDALIVFPDATHSVQYKRRP